MRNIITICILIIPNILLAQEKYRNFYVNLSNTDKKEGIALVLANNNYERTTDLNSAIKDGKLMVEALKEVDFDIEIGFNLNRSEVRKAISSFSTRLSEYKYAVVYYAGHGVQFADKNYIVPVDAGGNTEFEIKDSSIDIDEVLNALERIKIPKAIVLDACRENPFLSNLTSETMSVKGFGLAKIEALKNSIVIFSTAANTIVPDKNQFTEIFTQNIKEGGCIKDIIVKTRNEVLETDPNQLIFANDVLLSEICFGDIAQPTSIDDLDNDGIANSYDQCPEKAGPLENFGCPYGNKIENNVLSHYFSNGKVGMTDSYGELKINPIYDFIGSFNSSKVTAFSNNGKWGYINNKGKEIVPATYTYVSEFINGRGTIIDDLGSKLLVDADGEKIKVEGEVSNFGLSNTEEVLFTEKNNKFGISTLNGKTIIVPKYQEINEFSDRLCLVKLNSKYLYLSANGEIVLVKDYDYCSSFIKGKAIIINHKKYGIMDRSGAVKYLNLNKDQVDIAIIKGRHIFAKKVSGEMYVYDFNGDVVFLPSGENIWDILPNGSFIVKRSSNSFSLYQEHLGKKNKSLNYGEDPIVVKNTVKNQIIKGTRIIDHSKGINIDYGDKFSEKDFSLKNTTKARYFYGLLTLFSKDDNGEKTAMMPMDEYYRPLKKLNVISEKRPTLFSPYYKKINGFNFYLDNTSGLYGLYDTTNFKKKSKPFCKIFNNLRGFSKLFIYEDLEGNYGFYDSENNNIIPSIFSKIEPSPYETNNLSLALSKNYYNPLVKGNTDEIIYNTKEKCFNFLYKKKMKRKLFINQGLNKFKECN